MTLQILGALLLGACSVVAGNSAVVPHVLVSDILAQLPQTRLLADNGNPTISPQFAGTLELVSSQSSSTAVLSQYMVYDEVKQLQVVTMNETLPFGHNSSKYQLKVNTYLSATGGNLTLNDRCQQLPAEDRFAPFSWLPMATNRGQRTLNGRKCTLLTLDVPLRNISLSMCIDDNNLPVQYNASTPQAFVFETFHADTHAALTKRDLALQVVPPQCFEPPPICDGGHEEMLDVFIFHPANQFDIYNEDVADLLGDTAFICGDALSGHTAADAYQWVSRYTLQVWTGWGDYAECNRPSPHEEGMCISEEVYAVGREASYALKPHGGQCVNNDDMGSWFSLPKAGMCTSASQQLGPAGGNNCSWRIVEKVKTINGTCLLKEQGMLASCAAESDFPFPETQRILFNSFNSTDGSQGGCPDISPN